METLTVRLEIKGLAKREFEGHGATFGNLDLGGDIVLHGAFARTLADYRAKGDLPQMFWQHNRDMVPGKWLSMAEDDEGLKVKGMLANTPLGDEMHTLLDIQAVRGLSIGFRTKDYAWDNEGNRLLKEIDLWEVSLVSLAMNPMARVEGVKSRLSRRGEYVPTEREIEQKFRALGFSKAVARTCVSKLFDDDVEAGGMPGSRWDAGKAIEPEAVEAIRTLEKWADRIGAAAITKRF